MKKWKWIIIGFSVVLFIVLFIVFTRYYRKQIGPWVKYQKKTKTFFGETVPASELALSNSVFAARYDVDDVEWEKIEAAASGCAQREFFWGDDGAFVEDADFEDELFYELFPSQENYKLRFAYTNKERVRIWGQNRSCCYELILVDGENGKSVYFYFEVYPAGKVLWND